MATERGCGQASQWNKQRYPIPAHLIFTHPLPRPLVGPVGALAGRRRLTLATGDGPPYLHSWPVQWSAPARCKGLVVFSSGPGLLALRASLRGCDSGARCRARPPAATAHSRFCKGTSGRIRLNGGCAASCGER